MARWRALTKENRKWKRRRAQTLKQYSRKQNLVERDNNTKFFHACATIRKKQKEIQRLKTGNVILEKAQEIREAIRSHFEESFK